MAIRFVFSLCIALTCVLVVFAAVPGAAATGDTGTASAERLQTPAEPSQSSVLPPMQEAPERDATVTRIQVAENGSAEWSITIRMQLRSDEAEADFDAFHEEFQTNRSAYVDRFRTRMTRVVGNASADTTREMSATGFEGELGIEEGPTRWGYVTYRFQWDGFAPVDDGVVSVGDVLNGYFIQENGILVIGHPPDYESANIDPEPDSNASDEIQWNGPRDFDEQRPRVNLFPPDQSPPGDDNTSSDDSGDDSGLAMPLFAGATGVAVLAGIGVFYVRWRRRRPGAVAAGDGGQQVDESTDNSPELGELATEEDKVIALLESEDSRIKQSEIADRLDWSPSKTSRVLSEMSDDGSVEKLRIGRENVIDLADDGE